MAIETLTEGNKYSTTTLQTIVTDLIVSESEILEHLQFEELKGNSLTYNRITTEAGAAYYAPGDTWVESTPVMTQDTVTLKILGGDADTDNFLARTRDKIDIKQVTIENKVKVVTDTFLESFYYGLTTDNSKEFDGVHKLIASTTYNTVHAGSDTGTALSIDKLRQAIDLKKALKGAQTYIVMSKKMRRLMSTYLDSVGSAFPTTRKEAGKLQEWFEGLPIIVDDHIVDTETSASGAYSAKTGAASTTIFLLTFHPQGVCGVQGSDRIEVKDLGELETKDASRVRIKWYCGLKMESLISSAKVDGILTTGAVTA